MSDSQPSLIEIGKYIDINIENEWYEAFIVDKFDGQIKIRYNDDSDTDEWIDLHDISDKVAPLHTFTLNYSKLRVPSFPVNIENSHCVYYHKHKSILLIFSDICVKQIYEYKTTQNTWNKYANYTSNTTTINSVTLNPDNDLLYIFGVGYNNYHPILDIFDLKNKIKITSKNNKHNIYNMRNCNVLNPKMCHVPSPINELHHISTINIDDTAHFKLITNNDEHKMQKISTDLSFEPKFMEYVETTKQLISIDEYGAIYFCNVSDKNQIEYKWNKFDINMDIEQYVAFLVYTRFICMFTMNYDQDLEKEIYEILFIDLMEHKMFKSHKNTPSFIFDYVLLSCFNKNENALHFIIGDNDEYDDENIMEHIKVNLNDIIPPKMIRFYQKKYYEMLIFGYIADLHQKNEISQCIPYDIVSLLLSFYPPFYP